MARRLWIWHWGLEQQWPRMAMDSYFSVAWENHADGILCRHARTMSLYTPMPYSQASDHSVIGGLKKTVLLIGTPLVVACWRSFIHSWRYSRCHRWSRCGPHFFPRFSKWRSQFKKYCAGGTTCATLVGLPINDSSLSVLIFVETNASSMSVVQAACFYSGRNTLRE